MNARCDRLLRFRRSSAALACLLLTALCCVAATSPPETADKAKSAKESKSDRDARELFAGQVPRIRIDISRADMQSLREDRKKSVKAVVTENGVTWSNVAIHVKGSAGSTRSIDDKPALTLNMDKFTKGQKFHGLDKFHLNNSVQDPSYMSEIICAELYRKAGVPTARGTHARVWLNGRDLGLFVLKEGYDKDWLDRNFRNTTGNLYDGGFLNDIEGNLERSSGSGPDNRDDLKALASAARAPLPDRLKRLDAVLDLEGFTSFCILQALTFDWDGYAMKPNNYRLYRDPSSGKFTFIPHGMDQMFWESEAPVFPGFNSLVAAQAFQIPELRQRYLDRLVEIVRTVFRLETMTNQVSQLEGRITALLAESDRGGAGNFRWAAKDLRDKIVSRVRSVEQQLASLPKPLVFDSRGAAEVEGWQPRLESGRTRMEIAPAANVPKALQIVAESSGSQASWRCRLNLPPGRYTFEARARTKDVDPMKTVRGEGAGLRVSGAVAPRQNKLSGTSDWTPLAFEFNHATGGDVELVAELRANKGTVWFDAGSLKIVKRP
jgi:spore coat protein H